MLAPCYFCRRCLAARLSFFSPSRGAHPQRTISAPASLPVLNRAHCFFSTVGSHERGRIIICISTLLSSRPARSRRESGSSPDIVLDVRAAILEGTAFLHERVIESAAIFPAREKEISKDSGGGERRGKEETR